MCILMTAFPMSVAPKKVQKGTKKCPHVIPARSNKGFGIWGKTIEMIRLGFLCKFTSRDRKKITQRKT